MNWKAYKNLSEEEKRNEVNYIIGLDVGNDSSAIAFYNLSDNTTEAIDLSGGYGKPTIPTVMQYIPETKEWVFGEYAILNKGLGLQFSSLTKRLGFFDYIDVDGRSLSVASVLAMFIKELLGNVKNINPRAEIVGIVVSVPAYFSEQANEELKKVFKLAGYEKELISFVSDRECVLAYSYQNQNVEEEKALILDFGNRELRGGLYDVKSNDGEIKATSVSSVFDEEISLAAIDIEVTNLFYSFLPENADQSLRENIPPFAYQHKDMLFQKNIRTKPIKLYYNFIYPPAQHTLEYNQVSQMISPYEKKINKFIKDVLDKNLMSKKIPPSQVNTILCVGGGFDMLWAREEILNIFDKEKVKFFKNPKLIMAEGAAYIAAYSLGIAKTKLSLEDNHRLSSDIGLLTKDNFITLVERNGFWWQKHSSIFVLINEEVDGEYNLQITKRLAENDITTLTHINLQGLPLRPKGVTRLKIKPDFKTNKEMTITVTDKGFGELFPKSDFKQEFLVNL